MTKYYKLTKDYLYVKTGKSIAGTPLKEFSNELLGAVIKHLAKKAIYSDNMYLRVEYDKD